MVGQAGTFCCLQYFKLPFTSVITNEHPASGVIESSKPTLMRHGSGGVLECWTPATRRTALRRAVMEPWFEHSVNVTAIAFPGAEIGQ